jgi:hypothetical protein
MGADGCSRIKDELHALTFNYNCSHHFEFVTESVNRRGLQAANVGAALETTFDSLTGNHFHLFFVFTMCLCSLVLFSL